jgi:hypothetical protein
MKKENRVMAKRISYRQSILKSALPNPLRAGVL